MSLPIYIHVGVPKSGTSSIQENLFVNAPNIYFVGRPYSNEASYFQFHQNVMHRQSRDAAKREIKDYLGSLIVAAQGAGKKAVVISDENLSTISFMEELAERLDFPGYDIRFVLTIRNQISAINSFYSNHGRILKNVPSNVEGLYIPFKDWWAYSRHKLDRGVLNSYHYDTLYSALKAKGDVDVLLFEDLITMNDRFVGSLAKIVQEPPEAVRTKMAREVRNSRDSVGDVLAQRINSKFAIWGHIKHFILFRSALVRLILKMKALNKPYQPKLSQTAEQEIAEHYGPENKALSEKIGINLAAFGYPS